MQTISTGLLSALIVLAPSLALADNAAKKSPAKPADASPVTVMVTPFDGVVSNMAYAGMLKVLGTLRATGKVNLIHPKQLNAVIKNYSSPKTAEDAKARHRAHARALGANWIVTTTLQMVDDKFKTTIDLYDVGGKRFGSTNMPAQDALSVLDSVSENVVALLSEVGAIKLDLPNPATVSPRTTSLDALLTYASCYQVLVQQSIGIRQPVMLNNSLIDEAIGLCEESKRYDKSFEAARASLALAYALKGNKRQAQLYLGSVKNTKAMLPFYWIGKFWVLSRYYNVDQALEVLEDAIDIYPGFLLARGYLGESLNTMGRHEDALKVFEAYLLQVPNQPWVMGQIGYTYAKLRNSEKAVAWTKNGLRVNPKDGVLMLALASRMVDSGKNAESVAILRRIIDEGNRRGEVYLRLGYSLLLLGENAEAERYFRTALLNSLRPSEWRTRGRARYDLAKLWMRLDNPNNAIRQLRMAVKEGFRNLRYFRLDPDFEPLQKDKRFLKLVQNVRISAKNDTRFLSPFVIDKHTGHFTKKPFRNKAVKKIRF